VTELAAGELRLARLLTATALVTPVRLALGVVVLVLARVVGADAGSAGLAFVTAALFTAFIALNDPRRRFYRRPAEPRSVPSAATFETRRRLVVAALFPSTVGVCILAAIALGAGEGTLAALLGGVVAGLGLASLVSAFDLALRERADGLELYVDRTTHERYHRARSHDDAGL
jgi:hypothetical protein